MIESFNHLDDTFSKSDVKKLSARLGRLLVTVRLTYERTDEAFEDAYNCAAREASISRVALVPIREVFLLLEHIRA